MNTEYGKAVVEERIHPRKHAELSRYLRWEYGPGTGPGALLTQLANDRARKDNGVGARVLKTLARALRTLAANDGSKA